MLPLLVFALAVAGQQPQSQITAPSGTSQVQAQPKQASPADAADDLPVSLDRIERALENPAPIKLQQRIPDFHVDVFAKKPTLEDLLGDKFWIGPVPYGGMTHQEFMQMTTPKELQPYAGFTGGYLVAESALTIAEQWALKEAIHHYQTAHEARERAAARKEVLDALAALEKARKDAGLDK